ncbi:histone deacetylase [Spirulina sp. CS-785/01]|uniref:histone deacetylase family protein n=1 Tax=Spirulina sp. CS-785/01 TaxID=3021716 RepID=UPI0023304565|nr:histone deacetylase [Spirulina sp. CS-785/01]MDB9312325.1 histone deacetylase [Spirulina sp. CS-785/01]
MFPIIYSDRFLEHKPSRYHPECPERLTAIVEALQSVPWSDRIDWQTPTPIDQREVLPWLEKVHSEKYLTLVRTIAERGGGMLDADTYIAPESYDVALLAISAWFDGVDRVLSTHNPAFVLARPPGHHAEATTGMGFCLFSNAAIAAHYALEKPNINKVAILDWDVHHGNGTQHIVENNPHIAYCSFHQFPCYPGTGRDTETGMHNNVLNFPMSAGSTFEDYHPLFTEQVLPFLRQFEPDLLIVSAGFDAHHNDPLAGVSLKSEDYQAFTQLLLPLTRCILFGLEGGYDLEALPQSVIATIEGCF